MRRIVVMAWMMAIAATAGGGVWGAQQVSQHMSSQPCKTAMPKDLTSLAPAEEMPLASGRIVALDISDGSLTINHRGLGYLYIEPGTAVFHVQDRSLLTGLSPGDKVRFGVERDGRRLAITRLEHSN
jgi:Cu/Ag efflux protein CusF